MEQKSFTVLLTKTNVVEAVKHFKLYQVSDKDDMKVEDLH